MHTVEVIRTAMSIDGKTYFCEIIRNGKGSGEFVEVRTSLNIPPLTRFTIIFPH